MPVQSAADAGMLHQRFITKPPSAPNTAMGRPLYKPNRRKDPHPPQRPMAPCASMTNSIHGHMPVQKTNPAAHPNSARRFHDGSRAQAIRMGASATGASHT